MSMRPSIFGRFDRETIHYREAPARRFAVILATLFLLSLAAVAAATSLRAGNGGHDVAPIAGATLATSATH